MPSLQNRRFFALKKRFLNLSARLEARRLRENSKRRARRKDHNEESDEDSNEGNQAMKLLRLEIENVKRLKAIRIQPNGNAVIIGGENDQGKSSVLDSIEYLFKGKRAQCERPVREGAEKGTIVGELDDLIVKRTINKKGGTYLTVSNKDGAPRKSPQAILDKFIGALSFDPLAFTKMDKKAQIETLKRLVGLDFSEYDKRISELLEKRREANIKARDLEGRYREMPEYPEAPEKEVSISALLNHLGEVQAENLNIRQRLREFESAEEALNGAAEELRRREAALEEAKAAVEEAKKNLEEAARARNELERSIEDLNPINEDPIKEQIKNSEEINRQVRANAEAFIVKKESEEIKEAARKFDAAIKEIEESKASALEKVSFPVEGLSFDEGGVTFNGLPFDDDQIGSAARLKVSVAMGLALNPELKVILIRDGSLLDEKSLAMIAKMAADADAQVWIERVGEGPECQVIIEDGEEKHPAD